MQVAIAEGVKGAIGNFVCFRCPLARPQARLPATKATFYAENSTKSAINHRKVVGNAISSDHPGAEDAHGTLPHDAGQPQRCCRR